MLTLFLLLSTPDSPSVETIFFVENYIKTENVATSTGRVFSSALYPLPPNLSEYREVNVEKNTTENKHTQIINHSNKPTERIFLNRRQCSINEGYNYVGFIFRPEIFERDVDYKRVYEYKEQFCRDFIQKYKELALNEQSKFNIPASIILAQAMVETNVGESDFCKKYKNFFCIKCQVHGCSHKGHCVIHKDDTPNDRFRVYNSAWQSFRDHSLFLENKEKRNFKNEYGKWEIRYEKAFNECKYVESHKKYLVWSRELQRCGYATSPKYEYSINTIIEYFKLYEMDK